MPASLNVFTILSSMKFYRTFDHAVMAGCLTAFLCGCSTSTPEPAEISKKAASDSEGVPTVETEEEYVFEAPYYEATAQQLLDSRLPIEQTTEGWVRLFDQHTLFGWTIAGEANWRVEDGAITVDRGKPCLLTTSSRWADFELELQFKADAGTNSGVFVRTQLDPMNLETDCLEINIAPGDNAFPTASVVKRKKAEPFAERPDEWHTLNVVCDQQSVEIKVDGKLLCSLDDAATPRSGHIGLQHDSGRAQFKDIRMRPLGLMNQIDKKLSNWKRYEKMEGEFRVDDDGHLIVDGGKQQLESTVSYGDFALLADYKMDNPKSNSGLFFRAIPGDEMMGYECQVSNELLDDNPLTPADCGVGGIFRRQDARVVAGEPGRWNSILLVAEGSHFVSWVNGLQVVDVYDVRDQQENPRKGMRLEPGSLMVQGHDKTTQAVYRKIAVAPAPIEFELALPTEEVANADKAEPADVPTPNPADNADESKAPEKKN